MSKTDTQHEAMTDAQSEAWMRQQREEYAAGTLPQWKISRMEKSLDGNGEWNAASQP